MLSIQTNVNSMNAQENLRVTNQFQGRTIARLTSGFRINESGDDAAGLAIANKYRSDVTELMQGVRNANDGLSTLQIIDGGLNNISKIIDRLKTLATQSASATFSGNRATLNTEYQDLLGEINRQAANIGLGSGDTNATRNNASIKVFTGGGSQTSNSQVTVNLAGATNVVNSVGLNLNGTQISGSTAAVEIDNVDLRSGTFLANSTQTFRFGTTAGQFSVTVGGGAAVSGNDVVTQLNAGLAGTGITMSIDSSTGRLNAHSSSSFVVAIDARVGTGTAAASTINDASAKVNTGKYQFSGGTMAAAAADQTITFTPAGGSATPVALTLAGETSADLVFAKLKSGLSGTGIDVIRSGNEVFFQSDTDFQVTRGAAAGAGGLGNVPASTDTSATDKAASSDPTADALAALTAISNAVTRLGNVQGKVGTGQNRITYAIQLAQSQITSFSAAESRIRDADVASEAANLTKAQVLQQASLAALAQANSAPQAVLSLLRG